MMSEVGRQESEASMGSPDKRDYHCPHCGGPISPKRIGAGTNFWDVAKSAVIFAGIIGIIMAWRSF